ncbi:MAG: hypothetical protein M1275_00880 [Patescibacteria group bacterium]|nr:hypothetical protein [Patescibacteria group bacterium]
MAFNSAIKSLVAFLVFLVGIGGMVGVIFKYSPASAPWGVHAALYFSVFLAVSGLCFSVLLFLSRAFVFRSQSDRTGVVLRQALMLGALVSVTLALQSLRLLNVYTIGLLLLCSGILELYFSSR